jgi:DNA (cytosine-5)-methyltransferase 1
MKKTKLTYIDLFSGCGGLSEGFIMTNKFEGLAHVEWEKAMVDTLRNRLIHKWGYLEQDAKSRVVHFDIQRTEELLKGNWSEKSKYEFGLSNNDLVTNKGLIGLVGRKKVDIIIGGPPCQAYSIAGRAQDKHSMKNDYRNYLFESFVKVVDQFQPKVFVFENVPGLLSACPGGQNVTQKIFQAFNKIGYEIRNPELLKRSIFTASDFGVPQKRKRVIIVGVNKSSKISIEKIYDCLNSLKLNNTILSVYDAIGHLPKLLPLKSSAINNSKIISHTLKQSEFVKYHEARFHSQRDIKIFKEWIRKKMNKKTLIEKLQFYNTLLGKTSKHAKYRNLEWDKPSPTIVAHLNKDGLMFIHPDVRQARSITIKEAALLQSFPDDFDFIGNQGVIYKMIGNAVPPIMAKKIALVLAKNI